MSAPDINALFSRAERAFLAGELDAARRDLIEVGRLAGDHPAVLHLLALVEKKRGDVGASRAAFDGALLLAPDDPQILSNCANLLESIGEDGRALALYDHALTNAPLFSEARFNRALLFHKIGHHDDALIDLDALSGSMAQSARLSSARASVLKSLGRMDEAADAYEDALQQEPERAVALHGRARVAMERGEDDASARYRRALNLNPGDRDLLLGLADALDAEGDSTSLVLLHDAVERWPDWVAGLERLATLRAEAGHGEAFADHFEPALAARPTDFELHQAYWLVLAKAGRPAEALTALRSAKSRLGQRADLALTEGILTSESGDAFAADAIFDGLPVQASVLSAHGRNALRAGDPQRAAALLEQAVAREPGLIAAWAHLDLAWRAIGDARHDWLSSQPGLYQSRQLPLSGAALDRLATVLRGLHRSRAHPIGQSLRGGTQTRGRLFWRPELELRALRDAIDATVRCHVRDLPPVDPTHPLLKHRDQEWKIGGSWSVRLTAQGFHVSHIHPEGLLSSACYISLPDSLGDERSRDGWLEIGAAPRELGLDLQALATIKPVPGALTLFPSYLFHGTRPFHSGERLTVAFDVLPI